jgi:hypothetical protein
MPSAGTPPLGLRPPGRTASSVLGGVGSSQPEKSEAARGSTDTGPVSNIVQVQISPPASSAGAGQIFTVTVQIAAASQPVDGAEVHLDFDARYVQVVDSNGQPTNRIESSGILESLLVNRVTTAGSVGQIDFAAGTLDGQGLEPRDGTFALATIRFRAIASGPGQVGSSLTFVSELPRKTEVTYQGNSVLAGVMNGYISAPPAHIIRLPLVTGR